jgi:hypothetical protein
MSEGVDFKLDLDIKEFLESGNKAFEAISKLGEADGLKKLLLQLEAAATGAAIIGGAFLALKTTIDLVFDAENIRQVNAQFELLSENAGLAAEKLKGDLVKAANGMVAENELLKAGSKALVELGANASRVGEVMALARKATSVFGGSLIENFEKMNLAIATGSTRQLRHLGIVIDSQKATHKYADEHGYARDSLSKFGHQQAILNALLEAGDSRFKGVNGSIKESQNSWVQAKVALTEIGETLTLVFEKIAGGAVRNFFGSLKAMALDAKQYVTATFGEGSEKAAASLTRLEDKVRDIKGQLIDLDQKKLGHVFDFNPGQTISDISVLTKQLKDYEAKLEDARKTSAKFHEEEKNKPGVKGEEKKDNSAQDREKLKAEETKFQADMTALRREALTQDKATADSIAEVNANRLREKVLLTEEAETKIAQIRVRGDLDEKHKAREIAMVHTNLTKKLVDDEEALKKERIAALNLYVSHSEKASDGIARAFQAGAQKNKLAMSDFGKRGAEVFDSFSKHATNSLLELGAGTKSATDAMKGFFFDMLADRAQSEGELLMLSSVWPPNPLGLAAGGGLIALAGFLRSQGGSGGGGSSGASAGGGGGGVTSSGVSGGEGFGTRTDTKPTLQDQKMQKSVVINVQGHYMETDDTRQLITKLVRESADATDFTVSGTH